MQKTLFFGEESFKAVEISELILDAIQGTVNNDTSKFSFKLSAFELGQRWSGRGSSVLFS